jgi:hypothetical protein
MHARRQRTAPDEISELRIKTRASELDHRRLQVSPPPLHHHPCRTLQRKSHGGDTSRLKHLTKDISIACVPGLRGACHRAHIRATRWLHPPYGTDLPDGPFSSSAVQPHFQKYSCSRPTQITSTTPAVPAPSEGRFAIVTDVGRGMRWTLAVLLTRALTCGRRSRVVLMPRRRRQVCGMHFRR